MKWADNLTTLIYLVIAIVTLKQTLKTGSDEVAIADPVESDDDGFTWWA